MHDDGELVLRIGRGDPDAEAELCRRFAPRARLDETQAARKPVLVWKEQPLAQAAE